MSANVTSQQRLRILKLATDGITTRQIAERLGFSGDRVRRIIERAEQKGDVPEGTLKAVSYFKGNGGLRERVRRTEREVPSAGLRIFAPARRTASDMGHCTACREPTEVALFFKELQVRLCRAHSKQVAVGIDAALIEARKQRIQV